MPRVCPNCHSEDYLETMEELAGSHGVSISATGEIVWGPLEVYYDSSNTIGVRCYECQWEHIGDLWLDALLAVPDGVDPDVEDLPDDVC